MLTFEVWQGSTSKQQGIYTSDKRAPDLELPRGLRSDLKYIEKAIHEAFRVRTMGRLIKDYKRYEWTSNSLGRHPVGHLNSETPIRLLQSNPDHYGTVEADLIY